MGEGGRQARSSGLVDDPTRGHSDSVHGMCTVCACMQKEEAPSLPMRPVLQGVVASSQGHQRCCHVLVQQYACRVCSSGG